MNEYKHEKLDHYKKVVIHLINLSYIEQVFEINSIYNGERTSVFKR